MNAEVKRKRVHRAVVELQVPRLLHVSVLLEDLGRGNDVLDRINQAEVDEHGGFLRVHRHDVRRRAGAGCGDERVEQRRPLLNGQVDVYTRIFRVVLVDQLLHDRAVRPRPATPEFQRYDILRRGDTKQGEQDNQKERYGEFTHDGSSRTWLLSSWCCAFVSSFDLCHLLCISFVKG
ncbi:MAG: hypothetical protein HND48_02675 [Chloroflexi bacterium]|nr:hypothetical protein [Chloroflexota bacterium]